MRIITISREFGSGGRELGKRLAGLLGIDYYDREIITTIAEQNGLDEDYVEMALEKRDWQAIKNKQKKTKNSWLRVAFRHSILLPSEYE